MRVRVYEQQRVWMLSLRPPLPPDAEQRGQRRVGEWQQRDAPTKRSRREPDGADGVPQVLHAVAVGTLAVLPRFTPGNRRQAEQHSPLGKSRRDLAPKPR